MLWSIIKGIIMSNKDLENKEFANDVLIADIMLRLAALEKVLIDKNIVSQAELISIIEDMARKVSKIVLEKTQASKTIEELVSNLELEAKDNKNFKN